MFELPEDLTVLSAAELDALLSAARDEAAEIAADVDSADLDRLGALAEAIETLTAASTALAVAAEAKAEAVAAALARINPVVEDVVEVEAEVDASTEVEVEAEAAAEVVAEAEAVVAEAAAPAVVASAGVKLPKPSAKAVAARAAKPAQTGKKVAIVAAAGLQNVRGGTEFQTLVDVVPHAIKNWTSYANITSGRVQDHVFSLHAPARDPRLVANGQNDQDVINFAVDEKRLVAADGTPGLVAAGGWCAPAEQKYDICTLAELDGIWDVPTISVPRGSISYFRQLDYSTVAAAIAAGQFCFTNAELVVEPPVVKPCFEIPCAEPVDAVLDVCGLCLRVGILQQKAFPELVAAWLELALIAHARFLNARNLGEAAALMGAPIVLNGTFGTFAALLSAIDLAATDVRAANGMGLNRTLEVVLPDWVPAALRSDSVRRQFGAGDEGSYSDFLAGLRERNVRVQWVKDLPGQDGGFGDPNAPATVFPSTVEFWIYPAGAFVRGSEDVISVSTLVDSTLLSTNRKQLLFVETASKVMPACGDGRRYQVPICPSGETAGPVAPVGTLVCPTA